MNFEMILNLFKRLEVQIALVVLIVLFLVILIIKRMNLHQLKQKMQAVEKRYNNVKSVPLPFKLNKAVALARVNPEILENVNDFKNNFEEIQENFKSIVHVLAETEDVLVIGKSKHAKLNLQDLNQMLNQIEKQVDQLNSRLDSILEEENQQRGQITELKEMFRQAKTDLTARSVQLSPSLPALESRLGEIEKAFTGFEEWMYASEFGKAKEKMEEIQVNLEELRHWIDELPELIGLANGVIPKQIDEIAELTKRLNAKQVYTRHLEVENNLALIQETTQQDQISLSRCQVTAVQEHLRENQKRLAQLLTSLQKEETAKEDVSKHIELLGSGLAEIKNMHGQLTEHLKKDAGRFGWENLNDLLIEKQKSIGLLEASLLQSTKVIEENSMPSSSLLLKLKESLQDVHNAKNDLSHAFDRLSSARNDEDRAKKQLLKLHLIMNEIQVKIRKFKLPVISETYEGDLRKSYQYVNSIAKLLEESPLDIQLLNATVNDAIDHIYKLYNNVNNLVGTVEMIENTIVYGNKYRSQDAELDTQLTRAELLFRNGDYTQAIKVAIAAVEAVQPKHFEGLIKENAKSAY
jgi:septation ring formation regulator